MNELKNRGVDDILLAVVDGLKGFPDAITAVFPEAIVQTCIVHLRNSMDFVSWKDRKGLATALKDIYRAVDADAAEKALTAFEAKRLQQAACRTRYIATFATAIASPSMIQDWALCGLPLCKGTTSLPRRASWQPYAIGARLQEFGGQ
jgi:putative transposase